MKPTDAIRELVQGDPAPYLQGRCFAVFDHLRQRFPQARALYGNGHVVTLIDGCVYDARGLLFHPLGWEPRIVSQVRRSADTWNMRGIA